MKSHSAKPTSKRLGRPRSEQAKQDILKAAYKLLKTKGFQAVGSHEIAQKAGVSSATLYRWWNSKEEIMFDACFAHVTPALAIPGDGPVLPRLRRYIERAIEFLTSEDGAVMARLITGIHEDKKLRSLFLERYFLPRRQIQLAMVEAAIASGELEQTTDAELFIDFLNGPLFYRWLLSHAPLDQAFADALIEKAFHAFVPNVVV